MTDRIVQLSSENFERLQARAEYLNTSVESIVNELIENYLEDDEDDNTPVEDLMEIYPECVVNGVFDYDKYKAYLVDGLRESLMDVVEGRTRPADEALAELRRK